MSTTTIVIIFVIIVIIWFYYIGTTDQRKPGKERLGDAVSNLAQDSAKTVTRLAKSVSEPADEKKKRLAREAVASRLGRIYRSTHTPKWTFEYYSKINDQFKEDLIVYGLSESKWIELATMVFYIGQIRIQSRDFSDFSKRISDYQRESFLIDKNGYFKENVEIVTEGLAYFNIPVEEWIKYGDAVLEMHDVSNNELLRDYCIISDIKPMQNNLHLL